VEKHHGACHCGRVQIVLRAAPAEAAECNCSICRRIAGLWFYCNPEALSADAGGVAYQHGDCALDLWHCTTCGCTTHWTPTDPSYARVGVNLRMFDPALWRDLPRRMVDGASY
jgi:hypothetical protein